MEALLCPILTLDVEDWEHANFFQLENKKFEIQASVHARAYAMDSNTDLWIKLLEAAGAKSTCFVLGEFAKRYPDAVRRLAKKGHEIASHGFSHDLVYRMSREEFREFLKKSIGSIGEVVGTSPIGFRAPSWSVDARTPWYCEELANQGIQYDSSEFPVKTPLFGQSGASLFPHFDHGILRIPVTVLTLFGMRVPFASGAFFRFAPLSFIRFGLKTAIKNLQPAMLVLHPRELDPHHPRLPLKGWEHKIHYGRLNTTIPKLRTLLSEFKWASIRESASNHISLMT